MGGRRVDLGIMIHTFLKNVIKKKKSRHDYRVCSKKENMLLFRGWDLGREKKVGGHWE